MTFALQISADESHHRLLIFEISPKHTQTGALLC